MMGSTNDKIRETDVPKMAMTLTGKIFLYHIFTLAVVCFTIKFWSHCLIKFWVKTFIATAISQSNQTLSETACVVLGKIQINKI